MPCAVVGRMLTTPVASSPSSLAHIPARPRLLEVVVGRLLELVVRSVEGTRERMRARHLAH